MRIAIVTIDNRDESRRYDDPVPYFGAAPSSLLQGFSTFPEHEIHVISCVHQKVQSPAKIFPNVFYHSAAVGKWGWLRGGYVGCISAVRRWIQEIDPEIVHGQGTERYPAVAAVYSGRPSVLTIHGNMRVIAEVLGSKPFSFHWLTARLESFTLPRVAGVVCLSRYTQEQVVGIARRTWIIPNAAGTEFFQDRSPAGSQPMLLCPAIINRRKNQNTLIRALDRIASEQRFRIVFAGDLGSDSAYAGEFVDLVARRSWCEHVGFVEGESLRKLYREASLVVLPSIEDNCPMAILEAVATGVPVAASNVCGIPDLVSDGENGVLFNPERPEEIADKIRGLLANPERLRVMGARARVRAEAKHAPRAVAAAHLAIYEEVLGVESPRRENSR